MAVALVDDAVEIVTLYVSRRVDVPPLTAAAAFDAICERVGGVDFGVVIDAARCGPVRGYAVRRARGRLRLGRHAAVDVELDLTVSTTERCEVGLRPLGRAVPVVGGGKRDRYLEAAVTATGRLADAMAATVDTWTVLALS